MVDLLLPLGKGSVFGNEELKLFLRSLERYCTGWRTLWIAGELVPFVRNSDRVQNVFVRENAGAPKDARIALKQFAALRDLPISEDVVLMNDDYVFTKPVDLSSIPVFRKAQNLQSSARSRSDEYGKVLMETHLYLKNLGFDSENFDSHMPCRVSRSAYLGMETHWNASKDSKQGFVVRSLYHNVQKTQSVECLDMKIYHADGGPTAIERQVKDRWVFSYDDLAVERGIKPYMQKHFPDKSIFEL